MQFINFVRDGIHMWQVSFPVMDRGTHAVVGLTDGSGPLQEEGYHSLLGIQDLLALVIGVMILISLDFFLFTLLSSYHL